MTVPGPPPAAPQENTSAVIFNAEYISVYTSIEVFWDRQYTLTLRRTPKTRKLGIGDVRSGAILAPEHLTALKPSPVIKTSVITGGCHEGCYTGPQQIIIWSPKSLGPRLRNPASGLSGGGNTPRNKKMVDVTL